MSGSQQQDMRDFGLSVTNAIQCNPGDKESMSTEKKEALKAWRNESHRMNLLLDHFNSSTSRMYEAENQQLLNDLNVFIRSHSKGKLGYIPTAQIKLGMNVADNELLADMIEKSVTEQRVALFVVRLTSEDCSSFSSIKEKIVDGIVDQADESFFEGEEGSKLQLEDLSYARLAQMRCRFIKDKRPVVVIVDDMENCGNKPGLDSFLIAAQQSLQLLNLVVVLCCYTGCLTLQQLLPTMSCDSLYLSTFNPRSPRNLFQALMSKVILTPDVFTFKLSPNCLQLIIDNFVFVDISISRISLIIKSCLFRHFHSNPFSIFSCKTKQELDQTFDAIPKKDVKKLLKEVSKLPSAKRSGLLSKQSIMDRLEEIHSAHLNLLDVSTQLYLITKNLPGSKLASTVTGIFISFLRSNNYGDSIQVEDTIQALRFLTLDEFKRKLDICFNNETKTELSDFSQLLMTERETLNGFRDEDVVPKPSVPVVLSDLEPCKKRSEWKEKMKKRIAETPKIRSKFEIWRNSFLSKIKKYLQEISSPYFMPLSDLVYFDDVDYVVEHIFPSVRNQIMDDLRDPFKTGSENDFLISKVHKIIQEGEVKMDIHEMLENYEAEKEFAPKKKKGKKTENEESRKGLFVSSVYDLEFIGLIQRDKLRSEIFTKTTWEMK